MEALQLDVYMPSAVALRDLMLAQLDRAGRVLTPEQDATAAELRDWDGHYHADSRGALAFELVSFAFSQRFWDEERRTLMNAGGRFDEQLGEAIATAAPGTVADALVPAFDAAADGLQEFAAWGDMHRLGLRHPLNFIPIVGEKYRFGDVPISGSSTTVMKTAHSETDERHFTRFGSQSRHISDMSDPDANWFTLLGGQDGWLNSANFTDQFDLWLEGEYVQLPMRVETVEREFRHKMELRP